jgi:CheY-like chemotaxis protein
MDDDTLARVFEPFFTTNGAGGGSGLGLSTVRSIVEQCGGGIEVRSAPGAGAEFSIALPRATAAPVEGPAGVGAGSEGVPLCLLVVDDDPRVLGAIERSLTARGVLVVAVTSAADALERLQIEEARFDALVTDVAMPGVRGPDLADAVRTRFPGLPIVFLTGDPNQGPRSDAYERAAVLVKPARPDEIVAAVHALVSREPTAVSK